VATHNNGAIRHVDRRNTGSSYVRPRDQPRLGRLEPARLSPTGVSLSDPVIETRMTDAIRHLGLDEIRTGLESGTVVIVDVREPHEFAAGAIPGSVSMPLSQFDATALPRDRRVVFSCAAGVRSMRAIELAQAAGLDLNEHYAGGFKDWARSGEPIA
jgi:rhodanese-related sulfurtransferase